MAEILPIRRKTLSNQLINQSFNQLINQSNNFHLNYSKYILIIKLLRGIPIIFYILWS